MYEFPKLDECLLAWLGAARWRVLGRRLRPLSLMHRELLRMAGSGLVTGLPMKLTDLDLVVQICRRTPAAAARWLARPKRAWWTRARAAWLLLAYGWRLPAQWQALRAWAESCENAPEMLDRPPEPGRARPVVERAAGAAAPVFQRDAPPVLELWSRLAEAGFPAHEVAQVWPVGLVRWLHETITSRDGGRKFQTAADEALQEEARRVRAITEPVPEPEEAVVERARGLMRSLRPR